MGTGATEQGLRGTSNPTRVADIKRLLAFILSLVVSEWTEDSAEGYEEGDKLWWTKCRYKFESEHKMFLYIFWTHISV